MSDNDLELLARYTGEKAEEAFAEIVRRHLDLVYSAALRQVRSPQLAEEVTQATFLSLASDANRLTPDTIVAAWLYRVAHRIAANVVRREARRQLREQIATEMNAINATAADWTHIEPMLDEAMHALDETDRAAVLLRYFENKSLRDVGATLGASENAAQKRLSRAVERLREFFAKRGVTVGASGLIVVISANAIQAAPVGLAITISTSAALGGISTATTVTAATTKALIAIAVVAVVGTGIYALRDSKTPTSNLIGLGSSNVVVFSGTCAWTNFGANGNSVSSFRGYFRFATDSRQWSLEYQEERKELPTRESSTYDGQSLYTLYLNLPSSDNPGRRSDLADVTFADTPTLFAPGRMPWLAAWSFGLISPPTGKVLPPWALWPEASLYTNRAARADQPVGASNKIEFVVRASAWQALRADPLKRQAIANFNLRNDFVEGVFVVSAWTNLSGVSVPMHAQTRQVFPPERGGGLRSVLVMNTTNAQLIAGAIGKPRFAGPTPVNDYRSTAHTGLWVPMTRAINYHLSNQWLETSSPEWRTMVMSNAVLEGRTAVVGIRIRADRSGSPRIEEVLPGSPAQEAGLRVGDVVLSIDGKEIMRQGETNSGITGTQDPTAEVIIIRNAETMVVPVRRVSAAKSLK